MTMEQVFRINFKRHDHKLSAEKVGQCLISPQHFIGSIEIEDVTDMWKEAMTLMIEDE